MSCFLKVIGSSCLLAVLSLFSAQATAQQAGVGESGTPVPEALSPEAISALVEKLNDEQVAALTQLMTLLGESAGARTVESAATRANAAETLARWVAGFGDAVANHVVALPDVVAGVFTALGSVFEGRGVLGSLVFVALLVLAVALGIAAEWSFNRLTRRHRERVREARPESLPQVLRTLLLRIALEIGGLAVFAAVSLIAMRLLFADAPGRVFGVAIVLYAILIPRITAALLRFLLAPQRPDLRLVSTDDWTAGYIQRHFFGLAVLVGVALCLAGIVDREGIPIRPSLRFWVSLVGVLWLIRVTWKARAGLTAMLKGGEEDLTPGLERMAAWWPMTCIVLIGFNWLLIQFVASTGSGAITPGRGALAFALIIMAPFLDTMLRALVIHLAPPIRGEGPVAERAHRDTRLCFVRMGRIVLIVALVVIIGKMWGVSLRNLAEARLGAQMAASGVGALLIVALGYLAWELTNLWINRRLARDLPEPEVHAEGGAEMGGAGKSRMATILPLVRVTVQVTIVTITVLLALSQLGVNITPLLAGAGVFGLAIGFGAQTLVKDVVSGVFFLMDDAFRVGEFVDVGGTLGTVEKISVRSFQLRGARGPVHVVPYGSISKLTNMSRDWVIMKLRFTVPFDTDLDKVRKIFKKIGQQMMAMPEYENDFIEPFKSQGAADVTDVGIIVRGKFTAKPGTQFTIRKEIYNRVQRAFEENGIEFARKEVRVKVADLSEEVSLSDEQKQAIAAAAVEAAEPTQSGSPAPKPAT